MGNFSGNTFDKLKQYVSVRLQQGVPLLDSDWNEMDDIRRFELRSFLKWFVGDGVPSGNNGFKIEPTRSISIYVVSNPNISISLDLNTSKAASALGFQEELPVKHGNKFGFFGSLAEPFRLEQDWSLVFSVAIGPVGFQVVHGHTITFQKHDFDDIAVCTAQEVVQAIEQSFSKFTPAGIYFGGFSAVSLGSKDDFVILGGDMSAEGTGRCIVEGWDVLIQNDICFKNQKLFNNPDLARIWGVDELKPIEPPPSGHERWDLVYLDVWEREIDEHEDSNLLHSESVGMSTCTRFKLEWVVRVLADCNVPKVPDISKRKDHVYYPLAHLIRMVGGKAITEIHGLRHTLPISISEGCVHIVGREPLSPDLIVGSAFGASISGGGGGGGVFGSNLVTNDGVDLYTPYKHDNGYGYAGIQATWGRLLLFTSGGNTGKGTTIKPAARMVIDPNGNVGIGAEDLHDNNKLQVNGNLHVNGNSIFLREGPGDQFDVIKWNNAVDRVDIGGYNGVNLCYTGKAGSTKPELAPVLTVNKNGNVGIGTEAPHDDNKLQVNGNLHVNGNSIFLREGPGDQFDVIKWNNAVDRVDIGGYNGVNLCYTGKAGSTNPEPTPVLTVTEQGHVRIGAAPFPDQDDTLLVMGNMYADRDLTVGGQVFAASLLISGTGANKKFKIPHPVDPDHLDLVHACIEGPEAAVFYRGKGMLDGGKTEIVLPGYFEALTLPEGRTVLLTPVFKPGERISCLATSEILDGTFTVVGIDVANPQQEFFWEVKAVRKDVPPLEVEPTKAR